MSSFVFFNFNLWVFLGHDFSRANPTNKTKRVLQAATKLIGSSKNCQGTTSVVPKMPQNCCGL
jgi:hypothetical protein